MNDVKNALDYAIIAILYAYEVLVAELTGKLTGIGVPEAEAVDDAPPPPPPPLFFWTTAETTCPAVLVTISTSALRGS
jgi:hypothetical protein